MSSHPERPSFRYLAFGLTLCSDFELPELEPSADAGSGSDVKLSIQVEGPFPEVNAAPGTAGMAPAVVVLNSSTMGLRASHGTRLEVWEAEGISREFTRAIVLGVGMAVLLYQRARWPLHVSAVFAGGGAWLFGGRAGAGKSTLAAWLHSQLGYPLLADDAGAVTVDGTRLLFATASRAIRLLPDALPFTFTGPGPARVPFETIPAIDRKIRIRLPATAPQTGVPVLGLVMLEDVPEGQSPRIERLKGAQAIQAVRTSLFRPWLGQNMCSAGDALRFCATFLRYAPVYRYQRHRSFATTSRDIEPLLQKLRSVDAQVPMAPHVSLGGGSAGALSGTSGRENDLSVCSGGEIDALA